MNLLPRHLPVFLYLRNCQHFLFWGFKFSTKIHSGLNFGMCYRVTNQKRVIFRRGEGAEGKRFLSFLLEVYKCKIKPRSWWLRKESKALILFHFFFWNLKIFQPVSLHCRLMSCESVENIKIICSFTGKICCVHINFNNETPI